MNLKKFVSGISAFAVAASAFAGLAVSANAAYSATTVYTNNGGNVKNSTNSIDISDALSTVSSGLIKIEYNVNTTVDFSNGSGDRAGTATLVGTDSAGESISIISIYTNTNKNGYRRRYSLGSVANSSSTSLDTSTDNSTSHDYYVSLTVNLDNDTFSGTITKQDSTPSVTTVATDATLDLASLTSIDLTSNSIANIMTVSDFKVSTLAEAAGYVLTTTPYAKVTVGDKTYFSTSDGTVNFGDDSIENGAIVTIEKTGYTTKTITANIADGDDEKLSLADSTVSYYEDFSNVTDNFGFDTGVTVSNGVMTLAVTSGNDSSTTIPSVNVSGKSIHLVTKSLNASANHYGYLNFDGTGISLYYIGSEVRIGKTDKVVVTTDSTIDIIFSSSKSIAEFYVNGKYIGYTTSTGTTLTGLSTTWAKGTFSAAVSELAVKDVSTANLTIVDGDSTSATSYITGTEVVLPEAAGQDGYDFEGWSDGNNTVAAGTTVTVSADVTYTAVYTETATPATADEPTLVKDTWTAGDGVYAKAYSFNVYKGTNGISKVAVTVNGETQTKSDLSIDGDAIFGVIIKSDSEDVINGIAAPTVEVE